MFSLRAIYRAPFRVSGPSCDLFFTNPYLITQSIVFVTQVMARNQPQKPPSSSKKMARQGKRKPPKKTPVVPSSSSESDAEFEQPPAGSAAGAPDDYQSDGSLLGDQPPSQASDGDRSPERTSPNPSGRNSRQSSRSSRRSSFQGEAEQSEEDLQFISHQPPENLSSSDDGLGDTQSGHTEKFTAPQSTPKPSTSS